MAPFYGYSLGETAVASGEIDIKNMVAGFLQKTPNPSPMDVAALLKFVPASKWRQTTQALIANGTSVDVVAAGASQATKSKTAWIKDGLVLLSATASAYHGTRRNDSLLWGAWWGIWGLAFPVTTSVLALFQGFGKSKCARCLKK